MGAHLTKLFQGIGSDFHGLLHSAGWNDIGNDADKLGLPFEGHDFDKVFKKEKELGAGAFGKVYLAKHKPSHIEFAVKELVIKAGPGSLTKDEDIVSEIRVLEALNHPNIVRLYQFYKEPSRYFLVMEVMSGGELFDRIVAKKSYNEVEARNTMLIILLALKYMHEQKIVHRDLKPDNLLLASGASDTHVKIADFGLAASVANGEVREQLGTPNYIAPEILWNRPYGTSVDMWSMGVIFFILLAGYQPFHHADQQRLYAKIKRGRYDMSAPQWANVSAEAKDLVSKMLTVNVRDRITAAEALQHPWLQRMDRPDLMARDLTQNLDHLKVFNAKRKLRCAVSSVMAARRMASLMEA